MADTAHVLEQMRAANPAPSLEQLAVEDLDLVRDLVARRRSVMTTPLKEQRLQIHAGQPTRRRWSRPAFVAGLAGVLVLATLGVALVVFSGGDDAEPAGPVTTLAPPASTTEATEPPATTQTPSTSRSDIETPSVPVIGSAWTLVSVDDAVFGPGYVTNVTVTDDGFFASGAVGVDCVDDASRCRAALWQSPDGVQWERAFVDDADHEAVGTWMWDVARGDLGFLAMGEFAGPDVLAQEPYLVTSGDGTEWEPIEPIGIVLDGARLRSVVAADGAFLMAGQSCEVSCSAVVYRSTDGVVWTKVLDHPVANSSFTAMESVDGRFFAVGGAELDEGITVATIWTSADGITWTEASGEPDVFGATQPGRGRGHWQARAVTAGGPGYVCVGAEFETGGAIWLSEDGVTWVQVPNREGFTGVTLNGVVNVEGMLIAAGAGSGGPGVWMSADGFTWELMPLDPSLVGVDGALWQVAAGRGIAVAGLDIDGDATIWAIDPGADGR